MNTMQSDVAVKVSVVGQSCAPGRAMNRLAKMFVMFVSLIGLGLWGGNANAAVCTSLSNGTWNTAGRWSCGHVPVAADTVVIAHNITLNTAPAIAGLTVNSGVSLADDNNTRTLTITGNVTINGTVDTGGGRINLDITGAGSILSGSGTFTDARLYLSGANPTVATGSTLNFTAGSRIYTGRTAAGANALGSVLTINGTINSTVTTATTTFLRLYANSTVVGATGAISAAPSTFQYLNPTATLTNNGSVSVQTVTGNSAAGSIWTNAAGASLEVSAAMLATGTLNANAAGNTVNYTGAAQTVKATAYSNLGLSGSGAKAMGATTINGNFTMSGTATTAPTGALAVGGNFTVGTGTTFTAGAFNHTVTGNFDATGTFTPGTGTVTLNGAAAQTISGANPVAFNNLTVTNAANPNITLATNVVVNGTLSGTVNLTPTCPADYTLTSNGGATVQHSCPASVVNSINLADPSPTSAATVAWTVIFNTSVTGVDASAFSLVPTGVAGAYITAVTGSGTTWTVSANTGIGAGTLGLNQTGPGSVVPTLTGTFTGQVYTITATPALAEYRMDEAAWNGTANEVIDIGSGGLNGTAAGLTTRPTTSNASPAIAGSPGTCRYGVFNRTNKDYVALPAGFPNLAAAAGDFSITAWINVANNTLPGQRIFIDDEHNTSPGGWGFSVGETATAGGLRFYYRQPSVYILDTSPIPSNQWLFVALSVHLAAGANASTATIYAYNTAGTLVTSNTGTFTWTAGSDPGPSSIGGETNASGEGTNAFGFGGNLDELRVYQKALSQAAVAALAAQTHACPVNVPDHLVIQSSGSGLTCAASTLTVVACQDAAPACTPFTAGVSGTLSAAGAPAVNWDGTTGGAAGAGFVIPNGSSSVTKNVQVATAGSVVFGVSSATPTPINATTCNFGSPACTFTSSLAGFLFSDTSTPGNAYTILPQVSGIATPTLYLRAVQASTTNPAVCTPAIIGQTVAVNMGYACNNPASCQAGNLTTINATAVAPGGTPVSLTFDANGSAPVTARYDDVGQITLNANKTVTPPNGTAVTLNGNSNPFVVAPHHFGFSGVTAAPIKAGNNFSATVTAYNGLGTPTATANFGLETPAQGVTLSFSKCQPTGANSSSGAFTGSIGTFTGGSASATNLNWSEVGNGDLVATNSSYLSSGLSATGNTGTGGTTCNGGGAGNVGRFMPDHFDTVVTGPMACPSGLTCPAGGLAYSGQSFTTNVYAMNGLPTPTATVNYDGTVNTVPNFAKSVTLTAWDALGSTTQQNPPAAPPGSSISSGGTIAPTSFNKGSTVLGTPATPIYLFGTSPTAPTDIYIRATDTDATSLRVPANTSVEGGIKVVSGRAKIGNAYGSELLPLTLMASAQYYNATGSWVTSLTDTLTSLTLGLSNYQCKTGCPWTTTPTPASGTVSAGVLSFKLSSPGSGGTGSVDVNITAPSYLMTGSNGAAVNPSIAGRATFGVYQGRKEIIYMRENY